MNHWIDEIEDYLENLKEKGITGNETLNHVRFAYKLGYDKGKEDQKTWERETK